MRPARGVLLDRRAFLGSLAGGLLAAPLAAEAQPAGKVYRIGVLCPLACEGMTGLEPAFRLALRDLGYVEGRTLAFEYRAAGGQLDRLPALADELVQTKVDLIFTTFGTDTPLAAKRATATIPVVMGASGDPVRAGIVSSLAKPGSNVTGVSSLTLESESKRLELLKELLPTMSRVGFSGIPTMPTRRSLSRRRRRLLGPSAYDSTQCSCAGQPT
jgi:putative ABC transport system substrate-binding protein